MPHNSIEADVGCRYALIISSDVAGGLAICKAVAAQAVSEHRLAVVAGDRGRQVFPTDQTRASLVRFLNRSRSAKDTRDRVRGVLVIFHRFFPGGRASADADADIVELAVSSGYAHGEVRVLRSDSPRALEEALFENGFVDAATTSEPASFLEALKAFGAEFPEDAKVSVQALESARDWDYPNPGIILRDLRVIHQVYGRLQDQQGRAITPRDRKKHLEAATGLTLAYEEESVVQKYRTTVFPDMDGRVLSYPLHAKYSYKFTRIYFWFPATDARNTEVIKTLIAHAGCHLETGSKNDR